jgi:hypothetical protein
MPKVKIQSGCSIFISIAVPVILILTWIANSPRPLDCNIEKSPIRPIIQSSIPLEALWGVKGVKLENFEQSLPMVSTPELLITAREGCDEVTAFYLKTGDVAWKMEQDDPEQKRFNAINDPDNLALDDARQQIYVSGLDEIRAVSVENGSTIWRNASNAFSRNAHYVVIQNNGQLTVEANHNWYIDPASGNLSETPVAIETATLNSTATVDPQIRQILSFVNDYRIMSNAVRKNGVIYVLDSDTKLHLLNDKDANEVGLIAFEQPKKTELLYEPGAIGGSWITVEDNTLAIYFQDTDLLSVYKFILPK